MRTYRCVCDNVIFFDNHRCLKCGSELGWCPACRRMVGLISDSAGNYRCGNADCKAVLVKCVNYVRHGVCNRCLEQSRVTDGRCDCCRFNETIPDLTVPGNLKKWYRLEAAKRRLFYDLGQLGLPYGTRDDGIQPSLAFDFKADDIPNGDHWRPVGKTEKVFTGHSDGRITINIREADDAEREKLRVDMGEPQRTLIGHFRHEIGHFYWDVLVKGRREDLCKAVFGDHQNPSYAAALEKYYRDGPVADWNWNYVSAYASMHPWEDFAETWATYLDVISALDTAHHNGLRGESDPVHANFDAMIIRFQQLGIALNEFNRSMGLIDLAPQVLVPEVIAKLRFVHGLVQIGRSENGTLRAPAATPRAHLKWLKTPEKNGVRNNSLAPWWKRALSRMF